MKIYRCNFYDGEFGRMVSWHPSFAAARRHWMDCRYGGCDDYDTPISTTVEEYDFQDPRIERYEFDLTKKDLLEWLKSVSMFNTDNG